MSIHRSTAVQKKQSKIIAKKHVMSESKFQHIEHTGRMSVRRNNISQYIYCHAATQLSFHSFRLSNKSLQ